MKIKNRREPKNLIGIHIMEWKKIIFSLKKKTYLVCPNNFLNPNNYMLYNCNNGE